MATTLNGIDLGKIQEWRNEKQGNIVPIALPGTDSEGTEVIDMLGVIETLNIGGRFTGTFDECQAFLKSIKALVDGDQSTSYNLTSQYVINNTTAGSVAVPATINVKVNKVNYNWELPGQSFVDYQLQLLIGAATV